MKILVLGGTKYAGVHLVNKLLSGGHDVTIATRGKTPDNFGGAVKRKIIERENPDSLRSSLNGEFYDCVIDNLAYSSNEVRFLLDAVCTDKYILTSTASVYGDFRLNMKEPETDTTSTALKWCGRDDYAYDEVKRQAESALFQAYSHIPAAAVRFTLIFGKDDYTNRLGFYVENIVNEQPMNIDNLDARLAFINSSEAGHFLAWCAEGDIWGPVNASSAGGISLAEIIAYTEKRTNKKALLCSSKDAALSMGFRISAWI